MGDGPDAAIGSLRQPHPVAVGDRAPVFQRAGLLHARQEWRELRPLEGGGPPQHVIDSGVHAAVTDDVEQAVRDAPGLASSDVPDGAPGNRCRVVMLETGASHAERREDPLPGEFIERASRHTVDDDRQQDVSGVAVQMFGRQARN